MNLRLLLNHQEIKRVLSAARWQPFRRCHILITLLDWYTGSDVSLFAGGLI